jgi:hypothetical protein
MARFFLGYPHVLLTRSLSRLLHGVMEGRGIDAMATHSEALGSSAIRVRRLSSFPVKP